MWVRQWAGRAPRPKVRSEDPHPWPQLEGWGRGSPHSLSTEHHLPPHGARSSPHCPHPTQPLAIPARSRLALTSGYKPLALISPNQSPLSFMLRVLSTGLQGSWCLLGYDLGQPQLLEDRAGRRQCGFLSASINPPPDRQRWSKWSQWNLRLLPCKSRSPSPYTLNTILDLKPCLTSNLPACVP